MLRQQKYEEVAAASKEVVRFAQCPVCESYKVSEAEENCSCSRCGSTWNTMGLWGN
jgi:hypothetical protein